MIQDEDYESFWDKCKKLKSWRSSSVKFDGTPYNFSFLHMCKNNAKIIPPPKKKNVSQRKKRSFKCTLIIKCMLFICILSFTDADDGIITMLQSLG